MGLTIGIRIALAGVTLLSLCGATQAAEIRLSDSDDPNWTALTLSGPIVPGDSERLAAELHKLPDWDDPLRAIRLVLDSAGGDYAEGLRLARLVRDEYVSTYIAAGKDCIGACAFLFIAGGYDTHMQTRWAPEHLLQSGGRLIFEGLSREAAITDDIGQERLADSLAGGIYALLQSLRIDPRFFAEFLALRPHEPMPITKVESLRMLGVNLLGVPPPPAVTDQLLVNLCNWATDWVRPLRVTADRPGGSHATVTMLDDDALKRRLLLASVAGLVKPGPLSTRIREIAEHGDTASVTALYEDMGSLTLRRLDGKARFYLVDGLDHGGGFYVKSCWVFASLGGGTSSPFAEVLTGITWDDAPGDLYMFNPHGDVLYEFYDRDAVLP